MKQIVAYSLFFSLFAVSAIGLALVLGLVLVKDAAENPRAPKPPTITYAGSAGDNLVAVEDDTDQSAIRNPQSAIESPTPTPAAEVHVNFPIEDDNTDPGLTVSDAEDLREEIIRTHRSMTHEEALRLSDFVRAKSLRESQQNPTP